MARTRSKKDSQSSTQVMQTLSSHSVSGETKKKQNRSTYQQKQRLIQSIEKKFIVYILDAQIFQMHGELKRLDNCSILSNLLICSKIKKMSFLDFIFRQGAQYKGFSFRINGSGKSDTLLNRKLNKVIVPYYNRDENTKKRLEYQREKIRKLFQDFQTSLLPGFAFIIFGRQYEDDKKYLQQLDAKYGRNFGGVMFSSIISGKDTLNMIDFCGPTVQQKRQQYLQAIETMTNDEKQQYKNILLEERQLKLNFKHLLHNKDKFEINQSQSCRKLLKSQKQDLLQAMVTSFKTLINSPVKKLQNQTGELQEMCEMMELQVQNPREDDPRQQNLMMDEQNDVMEQQNHYMNDEQRNSMKSQGDLMAQLDIEMTSQDMAEYLSSLHQDDVGPISVEMDKKYKLYQQQTNQFNKVKPVHLFDDLIAEFNTQTNANKALHQTTVAKKQQYLPYFVGKQPKNIDNPFQSEQNSNQWFDDNSNWWQQ